MSDLADQVEQSIIARRLFSRGEGILVAVSGGLDSMVLLDLLVELSRVYEWRLTVAHFNHQLRGQASDGDERFVARAAAKLDLPFAVGRGDVLKHSRGHGISVEMAARQLRHEFLAQTATVHGISAIALAHHADDQVELFLLRLLRGSGGGGLAGMKWQNPSPADPSIRLTRPLLDQPKAALKAHLRTRRISFREDASNAQLDIQRNRIRHELIPLLTKHYQPAIDRVLLRQMDILGAESDFARQAAHEFLRRKKAPPFESLPVAVQRAGLEVQLAEKGVLTNFDLVERLRDASGGSVDVKGGLSVSRDSAGRIQCKTKEEEPPFPVGETQIQLSGRAGEIAFDHVRIKWKIKSGGRADFVPPEPERNCECFDAEKVGRKIILRHWRTGDRFQPIGMSRAVKLQDLFTNKKIPRALRHQLIVGETRKGELFWVQGLRVAEGAKLDKNTSARLQWRWEGLSLDIAEPRRQ